MQVTVKNIKKKGVRKLEKENVGFSLMLEMLIFLIRITNLRKLILSMLPFVKYRRKFRIRERNQPAILPLRLWFNVRPPAGQEVCLILNSCFNY